MARRQMQNAQVGQVGAARRILPVQRLPRLPEDERGEQVIPIPIAAKPARFAQQAVNHMAVIDLVDLIANEPGEAVYQLTGVIDL